MKLLIVDDNPKIRKMLREILSSKFEEIYEHHDGLGAEETYDKIQPDYVLMDIKMKHTDGISATKNILQKFPRAKIIMISHYNHPDIKENAFVAGAMKFINKDNLTELLKIFN
jgi:two-component system response regulator DegU